jgi:hypothetical protein
LKVLVDNGQYLRVTHANDPIPHLPAAEWDYQHSGGEFWIQGESNPVQSNEIAVCQGNEPSNCLEGQVCLLIKYLTKTFDPLLISDHRLYMRIISQC